MYITVQLCVFIHCYSIVYKYWSLSQFNATVFQTIRWYGISDNTFWSYLKTQNYTEIELGRDQRSRVSWLRQGDSEILEFFIFLGQLQTNEDDEGVFEKVFKDLFTKFKSGCFGGKDCRLL